MSSFQHHTQLEDGTPVLIRLLEPSDEGEVMLGFTRLSSSSRFYRLMMNPSHFPDNLLKKKMARIDDENDLVICAWDLSKDPILGIATAMYAAAKDEPDVAEAALTIIDKYQKRGLGTILLKALAYLAYENGFRHFRGYFLAANQGIVKLIKRFGAQARYSGESILQIDVPLYPFVQDSEFRR
ncbi:MAG: GNAT family N-acetyltransferase [Candidatus Thorarchaeota archaeon]|nr:GNAT family N-acetyltransferase [Candidatus Thorarchaeota archaeon]